MRLYALDVCVEESQVALLLPAAMHIEGIRLKSKFNLVHDNVAYGVMYIGGNFAFQRSSPELRVLSFVRVAGNVSA